MPIQKTILLYTFDELSEAGKRKAREWFPYGNIFDQGYNTTYEDAKQAGFILGDWGMDSASFAYNLEGEFEVSATESCAKILADHGHNTHTYRAAQKFNQARDALPPLPEIAEDTPEYDKKKRELCKAFDALEEDFRNALVACYTEMLQQEFDYLSSDEYADETIRANEWTFRADGTREDGGDESPATKTAPYPFRKRSEDETGKEWVIAASEDCDNVTDVFYNGELHYRFPSLEKAQTYVALCKEAARTK